ncbi:MAG TPA: cytochrome c [Bacteroidales bacterium]|nr:cytochrome c [Bacteroidales bacterium]
MKPILAAILLLALVACSTTKMYTPSGANENKRITATLAELEQGRNLYVNNCNKCHGLSKPESRTPEQWTKVLESMAPKAKLTDAQKELVYKYLVNY